MIKLVEKKLRFLTQLTKAKEEVLQSLFSKGNNLKVNNNKSTVIVIKILEHKMIIVKLFILSFHHHGFQSINANHSIQKVQLIWEMKEDNIIYTKALPRIRFVRYFIYARYSE